MTRIARIDHREQGAALEADALALALLGQARGLLGGGGGHHRVEEAICGPRSMTPRPPVTAAAAAPSRYRPARWRPVASSSPRGRRRGRARRVQRRRRRRPAGADRRQPTAARRPARARWSRPAARRPRSPTTLPPADHAWRRRPRRPRRSPPTAPPTTAADAAPPPPPPAPPTTVVPQIEAAAWAVYDMRLGRFLPASNKPTPSSPSAA